MSGVGFPEGEQGGIRGIPFYKVSDMSSTGNENIISWELRKLGELGRAVSGVGFPEGEQGGIRGIPFYKVSDMSSTGNENIISFANNYVTEVQIRKRKWKVITTLPAILFAKVGAAINLNRKRLCNQPFLIDNNMMAFLLNPHLDSGFAKTVFEKINMPDFVRVGALPSIKGSDIECYDVFIESGHSHQLKVLTSSVTMFLYQKKCLNRKN